MWQTSSCGRFISLWEYEIVPWRSSTSQGWRIGVCLALHSCSFHCLSSHHNLMAQALFKVLTGKHRYWVNTEHCNKIKTWRWCEGREIPSWQALLSQWPTRFLFQWGKYSKLPRWNRLCQMPAQMAVLKQWLLIHMISFKVSPYVGHYHFKLSWCDSHMPLLLQRTSLYTKPLILPAENISILLIFDNSRTGCH